MTELQCALDRLPVELVQSVLSYFSADEILHTFENVSEYFDGILCVYSKYSWQFQSIRRSDFDWIIRRIRPEQTISLTLCDDEDTPGQSELFLSHFCLEQFTHLQTLKLIQIEHHSLNVILSDLHKLHQLRSLILSGNSTRYRIRYNLMNIHSSVFSRLKRLDLNMNDSVAWMPWSHLRHLKIQHCRMNECETILREAVHLKSLQVCLDVNWSNFQLTVLTNQLKRLNLIIQSEFLGDLYSENPSLIFQFLECQVSMDSMKQFLSQFYHLKHLEIQTDGSFDLFDGYRWRVLVERLHTFHFQFFSKYLPIRDILTSFSTPFWLKEKHWFAACRSTCLFSVPRFAPEHLNLPLYLSIYSTGSKERYLDDAVKKITITIRLTEQTHFYSYVNTLELKQRISAAILASTIDLRQIKSLSIVSLDDLIEYFPLGSTLSQLTALSIEYDVTMQMIENIGCHSLKQVHQLTVGISHETRDCIIEELFRLFPRVEHLKYKSIVHSKREMVHLIDGFNYLNKASFCANSTFDEKATQVGQNVLYSRRLVRGHYTSRVYQSYNVSLSYEIHWWIGQQVN